MTISSATVWEVRNSGSDTNGGGWVYGASGTDYSQQNTAQYALTNGVTNGTTTVGTASASASMVGNLAYIAGGTGSITGGWYQITAASAGVSITVDRATGLTAGTGVTINIGGALGTLSKLATVMAAANKAFVRNDGTYAPAANISFNNGFGPNSSNNATRIYGYTSTRGDGGQVPVAFNTVTTGYGITLAGNGVALFNFSVTCNGNSHGGIRLQASQTRAHNCKVTNSGSSVYGISIEGSNASTRFCEVSGMLTGTNGGIGHQVGGALSYRCWVHDGVGPGIDIQGGFSLFSVSSNMTGSTVGDGFRTSSFAGPICCTSYKNARHGCYGDSSSDWFIALSNIFSENGGYGLSVQNAIPADPMWDGNAYYNNTSGTRHNVDDISNGNNGSTPYTNVSDVILSADPFVAKASNDFRLNTTAGGGAACRGTGVPTTLPGVVTPISQSYPDFGACQSQAGASGMLYLPNMEGT